MDRKKWTGPSQNDLKKAYEDRGKFPDSGGYKDIFSDIGSKLVWKVEDKSHKVRLLPSYPDDGINAYGMVIHQHEQVGANNDKYLCLKRMAKMNCPICEHQTELWETAPEMAKDLYPSMRYLVWMVDLTTTLDKQVAKLWSCPKTAMDDVLGISYKKATDEILNLAHPDKGTPIYFDREKVSGAKFSKYKNFQLDDQVLVAKDEWLDGIVSFKDILILESYETIKDAFFGTSTNKDNKKEEVKEEKYVEETEKTTVNIETRVVEKEESTETSIDDMDRNELEKLARVHLADDYEDDELADLGTKKLRRLLKEAMDKDTSKSVEQIAEPEQSMSSTEALKQRLRERTKV